MVLVNETKYATTSQQQQNK